MAITNAAIVSRWRKKYAETYGNWPNDVPDDYILVMVRNKEPTIQFLKYMKEWQDRRDRYRKREERRVSPPTKAEQDQRARAAVQRLNPKRYAF
jgi:hypothetical protein